MARDTTAPESLGLVGGLVLTQGDLGDQEDWLEDQLARREEAREEVTRCLES